jgi:tetratricopeptide (TPR) repeat protein
MHNRMQSLTSRPILAVVGHILEGDDPELRTLELAQRRFSREANRRDLPEEAVISALVWLAGTRLQMHNIKGTLHTLGHLRARSRGQFPMYETLASFLEIRLQLALHEYSKADAGLARLVIPEVDERFTSRATALKLSCQGKILSAQGKLDEAKAKFEESVVVLRVGPAQVEDIAITVEVCNEQGNLAYRSGQNEEGEKAYRQAETLASHIGFRLALAVTLRGRGALADAAGKHGEAIELLKQARDVFSEAESSFGVLKTCISLGRASYALGQYRQSLLYFEEAKIQCGQGRYPAEEAEINARIGDIMLAEGRYEKAAEFYERDLQIVSLQGTERARAHALLNVGRIQRLLGNFLRAEGCLQESFEAFRKLGDRRSLGRTLGQSVYAFLEQDKVKKARQAVDMLAEVVAPLRSETEQTIHTMLEGLVCRHEGDSQKAKNLLERSLRIFSTEPGFYTVTCRLELALALRQMGNNEHALTGLKQTVKEARELRIHDLEQKALAVIKTLDRVEWGRLLHSASQARTDGFLEAERVIITVLQVEVRELERYYGLSVAEFQSTVNEILQTLETDILGPDAVLGRFGGGSIQILFGLQDSTEPKRGYETAQKLFRLLQEKHDGLTEEAKLGLAVGLAVGEATKGTFGPIERREFDVYGAPVERARALASGGGSGEILMDEACFRALEAELDSVDTIEVTWRGRPLQAWRKRVEKPQVFRGSLGAPLAT